MTRTMDSIRSPNLPSSSGGKERERKSVSVSEAVQKRVEDGRGGKGKREGRGGGREKGRRRQVEAEYQVDVQYPGSFDMTIPSFRGLSS